MAKIVARKEIETDGAEAAETAAVEVGAAVGVTDGDDAVAAVGAAVASAGVERNAG